MVMKAVINEQVRAVSWPIDKLWSYWVKLLILHRAPEAGNLHHCPIMELREGILRWATRSKRIHCDGVYY